MALGGGSGIQIFISFLVHVSDWTIQIIYSNIAHANRYSLFGKLSENTLAHEECRNLSLKKSRWWSDSFNDNFCSSQWIPRRFQQLIFSQCGGVSILVGRGIQKKSICPSSTVWSTRVCSSNCLTKNSILFFIKFVSSIQDLNVLTHSHHPPDFVSDFHCISATEVLHGQQSVTAASPSRAWQPSKVDGRWLVAD